MNTQRTFGLELAMENAAFQDNPDAEVARILRRLADAIEAEGLRAGDARRHVERYPRSAPRWLFDANGNSVGTAFTFTRRER